ncbi:MAG: sugar ABC transporter substrate-binding protein [Hungatella hathewayi]|nr:sugar ABC transporter substrate-binding protein [Hungatella hathewayi]
MRKAASIMLAAAMVLGLTACSGGGETATATTQAAATEGTTAKAAADAVTEAVGSEASAEGYTIGFSPYTLTNEYFVAVLDGVQRACEELGCELIYFDAQNDPTQQATQIDDMIASGIDALVYIPYDSASSRTALEACRAAGIKVINVDNVVTEDEFDLIDGIIASDNTQLGYLSGQWVAEHHPDGANILIVHLQTAESCVISVDGFWKGVKENTDNPDAFVEVQVVEGKGETSTAFEVTADALQAHDNIDVIYCINDPSALGAVQAVEEAGRAGKVDVLGKDAAPISKHAIKEGKIAQSSAQRPTYMGYKGVYSLVELLKGGSIEFNEYIDSYSVTADNIDEFDLDSWDILE